MLFFSETIITITKHGEDWGESFTMEGREGGREGGRTGQMHTYNYKAILSRSADIQRIAKLPSRSVHALHTT